MSFIETSRKVYKDVVESMSANLIKRAKEIAAKMAGSYSNAVREIEKLQRNLSNHPEVKKALMVANEETLDTFTKEEISEKIKPFMISYSKNGQHAGFEDGDSLADIQNKAASLRKKGFTIDKMGRYNPPVKKEEEEIEEGIKPYVSMQRDQATGKMNYVVLDKDEKEVFRSSDQRVATDYWKKNFDKLKESNYIDLKGKMTDSQIANIKKVWSGKTKADLTQGIKDMISKMDPITKLGIKQAKINVLSDLIEATMSPQMISILKREYEPMRGKKITAARARQLMNILDKLDDKNLELLAKQNIPFVSSGSQSKLSVRRMGVKITNFNPMGSFKEDMDYSETDLDEACWTGYKQVGMKDKGGKKVPNCVPEDNEIEEGKIKDIFTANKEGESMAQIAKRLKISLSTVKSVLGEANMVSDISGISIAALKREAAKFKIKVARVTPGGPMGAEYEVTFTGAEKDLIAYAKEHLGFDDKPGTYQQLKKHLNMDYVPELEEITIKKVDGEKGFDYKGQFITDPTTDPSGRFDVDPKKYYKLTDKQLKDLKEELQKAKTPQEKIKTMVKMDKIKAQARKSFDKEKNKEMAQKLADLEEADLSKKQIKMVHKVADDLPKKDFKDRYGKEKGDAVRFGTATNMVKKKLGMKENKEADIMFKKLSQRAQSHVNDLLRTGMGTMDAIKKAKEKFNEDNMNEEKRLYVEMIAGLKKKSEKSGMPYGILKKVYDRGMAAWKGGHRPGASQQQWAFARVNSFITKSSGTWGGADKDLAAKVKGK